MSDLPDFAAIPETIVEHDQDACPFCASSDLIRTAVQENGYTGCGWGCSVCGWWTADLATMHEQLWPTGGQLDMRATDMVCPDCGVEGGFVDVMTAVCDQQCYKLPRDGDGTIHHHPTCAARRSEPPKAGG